MSDNFAQTRKVLLALEVDTIATRTSAKQKFAGARALLFTVVLAAKSGTVTITPTLRRYLADGTTVVTVFAAASALAADGTTQFLVGDLPAGTLATQYTEAKGALIPEEWDFQLVYSGAGAGNDFNTTAEVEIFSY